MLHTCEFCGKRYHPRAQVKNPRACSNLKCQAARQRANEREWHRKNAFRFDGEYFQAWRKSCHKRRSELGERMVEALKAGVTFRQDLGLDLETTLKLLVEFLSNLGMGSVNKLCNA